MLSCHVILHLPAMFAQSAAWGLAQLIQIAIITTARCIQVNVRTSTCNARHFSSQCRMLQQTQALPRGKVHAGWILDQFRCTQLLGFALVHAFHVFIYSHHNRFSNVAAIAACKCGQQWLQSTRLLYLAQQVGAKRCGLGTACDAMNVRVSAQFASL